MPDSSPAVPVVGVVCAVPITVHPAGGVMVRCDALVSFVIVIAATSNSPAVTPDGTGTTSDDDAADSYSVGVPCGTIATTPPLSY
jgi:hypothetical protein